MEETFGRYELVEEIGTGGMAEVYLAKSVGAEGLEKKLVIKRILPEYAEDDRFVEMFISEADIAVGLNHPNIVQIYDFGKVGDDYYLAMEYVDGPDLRSVLEAAARAETSVPVGDAIYVAAEVAKGLHYAHERTDEYGEPLGIVHRDVSPQNILISREGAVKVVDFGIARATNRADVESSGIQGKYRYMSPEQARGEPLDARSDVFSLGAVLFEMLCDRPLFDRSTTEETLSLVKSAVVPDIESLTPELPEDLETIVYRALEEDPEDRFESAREMQVELTRVLYEMGEIHDAMTLSRSVSELSEHLEPADRDGSTETRRTSIRSTETRSPMERGTRELDVDEGGETMLDEDTSVERFPPPAAARQRKEAVFIEGEVEGLLELKSAIDEERKWIQVLEEYTRIVDSITFKNDGLVHHVDETGFLVVLGIPVSSENDGHRGTRLAEDLQEAVAGMNLSLESPIQLSVGVAVGEVVVEEEEGSDGSQYSWTFSGEAHAYAEALADSAMPGEILVSPEIYRRIRREYEVEPIAEGREPEGEETPTGLRLVGRKSPDERIQEVRRSYLSLYGRELPLKMIRDRFRSVVLDETAKAVLVTGERGMGKSTLVEEFLSGIDASDARVVRGVATPADRDVPLGIVGDACMELMRLGDRGAPGKLRSTLERRIDALFPGVAGEERELLVQSLGSAFDVTHPTGAFAALGPEDRRMRTYLSLRRLLERFAERKPVVVAFDDTHYADPATLEFVARLFDASRDVPLFWLMAADSVGDHTERSEWQAVREAECVEVEELGELSESAARRMIGDLLQSHGAESEELVDDVYRWAGGHPMFIRQTVELLRDQDRLEALEEVPGGEALADPPEWLPSSVEELMAAKIDRLEPSLKRVLQRVALLWSPFGLEDVELVVDDDDQEVEEALEQLARRDLLERADRVDDQGPSPDGGEEGRQYRFENAMMREVASRTLVEEEAESLHASVADYLEREVDDPTVAERSRLARHLRRAGEEQRAAAVFLEAAREARERYGVGDALRLAERGLRLAEPGSRHAFEAQKLRTEALDALGETEAAAEALERLFELADDIGDESERIDVLLRRAQFEAERAAFEEVRELLGRARDRAEAAGEDRRLAKVRYVEAGLLMSEGDRDRALELVERAIGSYDAEEEGEGRRELARFENLRGIILRRAGDYEAALEAFDEALELARAVEDRMLERFVLNNSGMAFLYSGEYDEAMRRFQRALEECRRVGDRKHVAEYYVNIGHIHHLLGRTEEALSTIRKGIYRGRQMEVDKDVANGLITIGHCYLEEGNIEEAERSLHEGLRIADSIPDAYFGIHAMFALAQVRLEEGGEDGARTALMQADDGLERAEEAGMGWAFPYGHILAARALDELGRNEEAVERGKRALEELDGDTGYRPEEVFYYYSRILPEDEAYRSDRERAAARAQAVVEGRSARIEDREARNSYLDRPINRRIQRAEHLEE